MVIYKLHLLHKADLWQNFQNWSKFIRIYSTLAKKNHCKIDYHIIHIKNYKLWKNLLDTRLHKKTSHTCIYNKVYAVWQQQIVSAQMTNLCHTM